MADQSKPASNQRHEGFSLVTVAALGAMTMMWLLAVSAAIIPTYQRAANGRFQTLARNAAEAGLDYAVAELNAAVTNNLTSPIDDTTQDSQSKMSDVPAVAIGNSAASVKIYVNNVAPNKDWTASYNELKDSANPSSPFFGQANRWRTIFSVASYAGISRSIGVVLEPIAVATTNPSGSSGSPSQTPVPYFRYAMFGRALMSMSGNASTDGYDSRNGPYGGSNKLATGGDVGTNASVTVSGNARVGGDLVVYSTPSGSTTSQVASQSGNAIVNDQLVINGVDNNAFVGTSGGAAQSGDNVLGMDRPPADPTYKPILESQSNPPIEYPAAPSAPSGAINLGALNVSGNTTKSIPPGDYKVNSISVSGNGKILLVPDAQGHYGPVRFFVEGSSTGSNVIQLTGNSIINPTNTPSNLQIWYGGSKGVLVSGNSNFYGVVYSPGSDIKITGNGTFFGSFVGNTVTNSGNGYVHFDKALSANAVALGLTYVNTTTSSAGTGTTLLFTGYRTISWHEF